MALKICQQLITSHHQVIYMVKAETLFQCSNRLLTETQGSLYLETDFLYLGRKNNNVDTFFHEFCILFDPWARLKNSARTDGVSASKMRSNN